MKFHNKRGHMLHKRGHHHLKRKLHHVRGKHFKLMRSMFDDGEHPSNRRCLDGLPKKSMMAARHHFSYKKHFKDMRGHSSSDSDGDDHHHHGHHHHHMRGRGMPGSGDHHGQGLEEQNTRDSIESHHRGMRGHCSSDCDDGDHRHHGHHHHHKRGRDMPGSNGHHGHGLDEQSTRDAVGSHHRGMRGHFSSDCDDSDHRHHGHHQHHKRGRGMSGSDRHHGKGLEDTIGNHHRGMRMSGHCMSDVEDDHHGRGMPGRCMSEGPHLTGKHHKRLEGRCMSEGPHGSGKLFKSMYGRFMSDSDDHHHGKGRHMRRMMPHHRGKHGMNRHSRRGFFDDDSALVPICVMEGNSNSETQENTNTNNQPTDVTEEVVREEVGTSRDQGTQTTGIMEIVIEDQEALSAAIRIVNKFL